MQNTTEKNTNATLKTGNGLLAMSESAALRGIAILGIMLHNYCHWLGFAVKENEYTFDAERPMQFWDKLMSFDSDLFIHFFSFFGHYGVPVFLFVSGFGLVKKYEKGLSFERRVLSEDTIESKTNIAQRSSLDALHFMKKHFLKLFRLMIIGYVVFVIVYFLRNSNAATVFSIDHVIAQLTMVINFVYKYPDKAITPGPYWFFGLMVQLYALYILLYNRWRNWKVLIVTILICWAVEWAANAYGWGAINFVRYNFIGGVLPFAMGIAYARWGKELTRMGYLALTLLSALVVLFGSFWFHGWLWVPVAVVVGAVSTVRLLPSWLLNPAAWVGALSAAIFVMHPVARELIISHYRRADIYGGIAVYVFSAFAMAMLLRYFLKYIPKP